jgi:hypothetical protein
MPLDVSWLPKGLQAPARMLITSLALLGAGGFVSDRINSVVKRIDILELNIKNSSDLQKIQVTYKIETLEGRITRLETLNANPRRAAP